TLVQLHRILQRVMGWEGSHLYQFVISGTPYGEPALLGELDAKDARRATLEALGPREKSKFLYEYDFGDSWEHGHCTTELWTRHFGTRHISNSSSVRQQSVKPSSIAGEYFLYFTSKRLAFG